MAKLDLSLLPAAFLKEYNSWTAEGKRKWAADRLQGQIDHMFLGTKVLGGDFQPNPHGRYDSKGRYVGLFSNFLPKDPKQEKPLYELDAPCSTCSRFNTGVSPNCTACGGTGRVLYRKRMILWPRGSFKSSAVVIEIIQLILNYPNIRICFMTGNQKLARRRLKQQVKKAFEQPTKMFRLLYPEFCGKDLGDMDEFTVPCRTADFIDQPTFCISTAKSINAGSHFDVVFVDDLVNEQNYKSVEALEKCWEEYRDIGPYVAPGGFLFVTGTRYSFGDTYERIREAAEREMRDKGKTVWKIDIRTCWIESCTCGHPDSWHNRDLNFDRPPCLFEGCKCTCFVGDGNREVLFPQFTKPNGDKEGYSVEFLETEKNEKGDEWFACQYENHPIAKGSQAFTSDLLQQQTIYDKAKLPQHGMTFIMGDLAYIGNKSSTSKYRDESVFYVCRAVAGQIFILDCIHGKWDADLVAEKVVWMANHYRPNIIWIERFNGWDAYDSLFRSKAQQVGLMRLPIEWLKMDTTAGAKVIRIGSIKGWLAQKKLWISAAIPGYDELTRQLLRWPKLGRHDDFADCLGLVCNAPHGQALEMIPSANPTALSFMLSLKQQAEQGGGSPPSGPCGSTILC